MSSIIKRPGFSDRFDRARKQFAVAFADEPRFLQSSELNELQSLSDDKLRRVSDYILQDGRIVDGPDPVVTPLEDGTIRVDLPAVSIYIAGLVHDVPARTIVLSATGSHAIGVRRSEALVTDVEEPELKGDITGTEAYMEPGAARVSMSVEWGHSVELSDLPLIAVYAVQDGTIITTETNIDYSEIYKAIENYSRESNGSFVNSGCSVTALGIDGEEKQVFSIAEGVAYVNGRRVPRAQSLRFAIAEEPDLRAISAEPHAFTTASGGTQDFTLSKSPIAAVQRVTIIKEVTENVLHGAFSGVSDPLQHPSAERIIEVKAGSTVYTSPASWLLSQGEIDWSPGGAEPAPGTSYTVKYRYYENIDPDQVTRDSIKVTGAAQGTNILVDYTYKLPRIDVIAMEPTGQLVYIKGTSATSRARPPVVPGNRLELARVVNKWGVAPDVIQSAVRNIPYSELTDLKEMVIDLFDLVAQERLKTDASSREVAAKRGVFVDPFLDDDMRDQGIAQTAASFGGKLRLPIHARVHEFPALTDIEHLVFTEEVIISQLRESGSMKINPYQTFTPMPGRASLEPSTDIWTETETVWTSPETQSFEAADGEYITGISLEQRIETVRTTTRAAEFVRARAVNFRLEGFIEGELLEKMWFDDVEVVPAGILPADETGVITGTFTIPAGVPTGTKTVYFQGSVGTVAAGSYVGRGTITVEEQRLASSLSTTTEVMPQPINQTTVINNITNVTNNTTNVTQVNNVTPVTSTRSPTRPEFGSGGDHDPLAQTFTLTRGRCIAGVRLKCAAIGARSNAIFLQIRTTDVGLPTSTVLAEAFVSGAELQEGAFFTARFRYPVYLEPAREYCFVALTDDGDHALAIAQIGKIDVATNEIITGQPFTVGVLLSSSNASTWTVHNDADLVFQLIACRFEPSERTVTIGTFQPTKMSDIIVSAGVEYPSPVADIEILLKRPNGQVIRSSPSQTHRLDEYIQNETIEVSALLRGTAEVTPFLFPTVQIIEGELQPTADYVTRAVTATDADKVMTTFDALLPTGSSVKVEIGVPGNYAVVNVFSATQLGDGLVEQTYVRAAYPAANLDARTRITLTGTPAARPELSSLRMITSKVA
ncbi:DUF4815 domain-containing protein [Phyllobacterium phragmitis]|uniref:DUF4815 domain-containing protein n=1 Tax=Phyllobacterium phragmitis TaxID=2670329 RepID=A0A2S9IP75_9HYPH|nr:DUF4815 domain-containing protein [Phyllobacterium phragmitis]PRD42331.1 DUF4815 domain-containing protein [Phyllobacterium phragmitis]